MILSEIFLSIDLLIFTKILLYLDSSSDFPRVFFRDYFRDILIDPSGVSPAIPSVNLLDSLRYFSQYPSGDSFSDFIWSVFRYSSRILSKIYRGILSEITPGYSKELLLRLLQRNLPSFLHIFLPEFFQGFCRDLFEVRGLFNSVISHLVLSMGQYVT